MHFSTTCSIQNFKISRLSGPILVGIRVTLNQGESYTNFLRYNSEKLIRTLYIHFVKKYTCTRTKHKVSLTWLWREWRILKKIKKLGSLPENVILVSANMVGLYPSIPYETGLEPLEKALEGRCHKEVSTDKLVKKAQFLFKNKIFKFNVFQTISGTVIDTNFPLPYSGIFMDQIETKFLLT